MPSGLFQGSGSFFCIKGWLYGYLCSLKLLQHPHMVLINQFLIKNSKPNKIIKIRCILSNKSYLSDRNKNKNKKIRNLTHSTPSTPCSRACSHCCGRISILSYGEICFEIFPVQPEIFYDKNILGVYSN